MDHRLLGPGPAQPVGRPVWRLRLGHSQRPEGDPNSGDDQNYSEQYWNLSFGIVWYPGWKAANDTVSGHAGLPLLPVADNGTFMVFARPGDL